MTIPTENEDYEEESGKPNALLEALQIAGQRWGQTEPTQKPINWRVSITPFLLDEENEPVFFEAGSPQWTPELEELAKQAEERVWEVLQKLLLKDQLTGHDPETCPGCQAARAARASGIPAMSEFEALSGMGREKQEEAKRKLEGLNRSYTQTTAETSRKLRDLEKEQKEFDRTLCLLLDQNHERQQKLEELERRVEILQGKVKRLKMAKRGPGWRPIRRGWRGWFGWLKCLRFTQN